ncbi:unnamed protein product [Oikopleura dioica]|uniref:Flavin-containing monooxygenase n=1 Tax=Oikopleura dioica TaxID=34765 RepID=E4WR80_OIKDI|nr:unnamed protein product [Oikopleura dioica]
MDLEFTVIERGSTIGGTWYWNNYPGIGCDVPSHLYSFSFFLKSNWTHFFSYGGEIQRYLRSCFYHFSLGENIEFDTEITRAYWNENTRLWEITKLKDGKTTNESFNILISCAGGLHRPNWGGFRGVEKYKGVKVHTTRWPKDLDLNGKTVGLIGSGASSIQILPSIVKNFKIKKLVHFQRNAAFVLPRNQFAYSNRVNSFLAIYPFGVIYRWLQYVIREIRFIFLWRFYKLGVNQWIRELHAKGIRKHIKDEKVAEAMVPDYVMGCKRILISDEFYTALNEPCYNLDNSGILELNERGIVTKSDKHQLDVIVFATGFDLTSNFKFLTEVNICYVYFLVFTVFKHNPNMKMLKGGEDIKTLWGIFYPNVPNFVSILGPMTGLGHNSIIFMIECQIQAIINVIKMLFDERKDCFMPTEKAVEEWNEEWVDRIESSIWSRSNCVSWYQQGDPNNRAWGLWPGSCTEYWWRTSKIPESKFKFFN